MFFSPMGFAVGLAIAQRNNLPQSSAVPVGLVGGVAGSNPLGLVMALALAQRSQPQQPVAVAIAVQQGQQGQQGQQAPQAPIGTSTGIRAKAQDLGGIYVVDVDWDAVDNAKQYLINYYHRHGQNADWVIKESVTIFDHHPVRVVLPPAATSKTVPVNYGYSVTAMNGIANVGSESGITQVTL